MKMIAKLETRVLMLFGILLVVGVGSISILVNKYSYVTFSHFVETCKQLVHTSLPLLEHLKGTLVLSVPLLSGMLLVLYFVISYVKTELKIRKLLKYKTLERSAVLNGLLMKHKIRPESVTVVRYKKPLAVTYGLFKQKILVSDWITSKLTEQEVEAILLHELYHIKNKHLPLYLLGQATSSILFYLPVVSGLVKNIKFKLEREADIYTQQKQNTKKYLQSALIKTLLGDDSFKLLPNFSANLYENRINSIKGDSPTSFITKKQIAITIVSVALFTALYVFPTRAHAELANNVEAGVCTSEQDCGTHCSHELEQNFTPVQLQSFIK